MVQPPALTAEEQQVNDAWNEHLRTEFVAHSAEEAIATMVAHPRVNQVPVMIGGEGRDELYEFYAQYFLPQIPPDTEMVPVSRTIGQGRLVDELVAIQPGHTLVTSGIYGLVRHPSYLGLLVNALGWGLAFRSGVGLLLTALMIPPLLARIRAEERLLGRQFGAEYDAYCARTSRLIPGLY
jgi:hypothetical protein